MRSTCSLYSIDTEFSINQLQTRMWKFVLNNLQRLRLDKSNDEKKTAAGTTCTHTQTAFFHIDYVPAITSLTPCVSQNAPARCIGSSNLER